MAISRGRRRRRITIGGGCPSTYAILRSIAYAPALIVASYTLYLISALFLPRDDVDDGVFASFAPKKRRPWSSSNSAVLSMATNMNLDQYRTFVGSLRSTGYNGHIILGISPDAPSDVVEYLESEKVTIHRYYKADKCTYDGYVGNEGKPIDMNNPPSRHAWQCSKEYPDYKMTHGRFVLYKDWLMECSECTDGIMLTDARDAYFQADPFRAAVRLGMQHPILVFEEVTGTGLDNTHWLTDFPVQNCRKYTLGKTPMLCSGSTMGSREGILEYLTVMREEFDYWKTREECRIDIIGDDQSIHNYLYYTGRFKNARAIPHRTGPIHVVGYTAARIYENVTKEVEELANGWTSKDYYVKDAAHWQKWLPEEFGLIDQRTGLIVNLDGLPSAQVHQFDRFNDLSVGWFRKMEEIGWLYNRDQ